MVTEGEDEGVRRNFYGFSGDLYDLNSGRGTG